MLVIIKRGLKILKGPDACWVGSSECRYQYVWLTMIKKGVMKHGHFSLLSCSVSDTRPWQCLTLTRHQYYVLYFRYYRCLRIRIVSVSMLMLQKERAYNNDRNTNTVANYVRWQTESTNKRRECDLLISEEDASMHMQNKITKKFVQIK